MYKDIMISGVFDEKVCKSVCEIVPGSDYDKNIRTLRIFAKSCDRLNSGKEYTYEEYMSMYRSMVLQNKKVCVPRYEWENVYIVDDRKLVYVGEGGDVRVGVGVLIGKCLGGLILNREISGVDDFRLLMSGHPYYGTELYYLLLCGMDI